jgi:hypothetical protein
MRKLKTQRNVSNNYVILMSLGMVKSMYRALISTQPLREEISRREGLITRSKLLIDPKIKINALTAKSMVTSTGNALTRTSINLILTKRV